ncbi:MAG: SpoIVB peptidase [Firmicutes bacterium]|nr:SpoIVB peptidase [[Eubacterium] siraeum]MCM1488036.1 SpoIVB peptidase [Bacillota bacterium]
MKKDIKGLKRQLEQAAGIAKQYRGSAEDFKPRSNRKKGSAALETGNVWQRLYILILCLSVVLFVQMAFYNSVLPDNFYRSENRGFQVSAYPSVTAAAGDTVMPAAAAYKESKTSEKMTLMLYGIIPIKDVKVSYVNFPKLIPSGEAFGLKMLTDGVMVTEYGAVEGTVSLSSPAKEGGLLLGDVIISANGVKISSGDELTKAVQLNGDKTKLTVLRGEDRINISITPARSKTDGLYKLGIWTRDSCAGIGTLTYYDPANGSYGGLGHSVCDMDTGNALPLSRGETVPVKINSVIKGLNGCPGELCGTFLSAASTGSILMNTDCGIFGESFNIPDSGAIPLGLKQEVEIGEATLLTTLEGDAPKPYSVMIEKVNFTSESAVKNMVIRITDKELLSKTGGIVQGMSGSPIIQNGKLVGAVTHVFVNDISRGYGIFAENMYDISSTIGNGKSGSDDLKIPA